MSKSAQIREMYDNTNMTVAEIAEAVGVRYQFAYNVISRHCAKKGEEVRKANPVTTSQMIRELAAQGLTPGQIAKKLNTNYAFVHQVVRKFRQQLEEGNEEDEQESSEVS